MASSTSGGGVERLTTAVCSEARFGIGAGDVAGVRGFDALRELKIDIDESVEDSSEELRSAVFGHGRNLPAASRCGYGGKARF
jgi:hypothetical protein